MTTHFSILASASTDYKDLTALDMEFKLSSLRIANIWVVKVINKSWVSGPGRKSIQN